MSPSTRAFTPDDYGAVGRIGTAIDPGNARSADRLHEAAGRRAPEIRHGGMIAGFHDVAAASIGYAQHPAP